MRLAKHGLRARLPARRADFFPLLPPAWLGGEGEAVRGGMVWGARGQGWFGSMEGRDGLGCRFGVQGWFGSMEGRDGLGRREGRDGLGCRSGVQGWFGEEGGQGWFGMQVWGAGMVWGAGLVWGAALLRAQALPSGPWHGGNLSRDHLGEFWGAFL